MELMDAVINNRINQVRELLTAGADPNATEDHCKITPLHFAAISDFIEVAHLLLEFGANPRAKTSDGVTPLDDATTANSKAMIQLINSYLSNTPIDAS